MRLFPRGGDEPSGSDVPEAHETPQPAQRAVEGVGDVGAEDGGPQPDHLDPGEAYRRPERTEQAAGRAALADRGGLDDDDRFGPDTWEPQAPRIGEGEKRHGAELVPIRDADTPHPSAGVLAVQGRIVHRLPSDRQPSAQAGGAEKELVQDGKTWVRAGQVWPVLTLDGKHGSAEAASSQSKAVAIPKEARTEQDLRDEALERRAARIHAAQLRTYEAATAGMGRLGKVWRGMQMPTAARPTLEAARKDAQIREKTTERVYSDLVLAGKVRDDRHFITDGVNTADGIAKLLTHPDDLAVMAERAAELAEVGPYEYAAIRAAQRDQPTGDRPNPRVEALALVLDDSNLENFALRMEEQLAGTSNAVKTGNSWTWADLTYLRELIAQVKNDPTGAFEEARQRELGKLAAAAERKGVDPSTTVLVFTEGSPDGTAGGLPLIQAGSPQARHIFLEGQGYDAHTLEQLNRHADGTVFRAGAISDADKAGRIIIQGGTVGRTAAEVMNRLHEGEGIIIFGDDDVGYTEVQRRPAPLLDLVTAEIRERNAGYPYEERPWRIGCRNSMDVWLSGDPDNGQVNTDLISPSDDTPRQSYIVFKWDPNGAHAEYRALTAEQRRENERAARPGQSPRLGLPPTDQPKHGQIPAIFRLR